jgi:hypothetical protein
MFRKALCDGWNINDLKVRLIACFSWRCSVVIDFVNDFCGGEWATAELEKVILKCLIIGHSHSVSNSNLPRF